MPRTQRNPGLTSALPPQSQNYYWAAAIKNLDEARRDIIQQALASETQATSSGTGPALGGGHSTPKAWPDTLLEICVARQEEYREKRAQWRFCFLGRDIRVRDILDGLVKFLDKVKQVGDVAANADPVHAGLPWAVARALLLVFCPSLFQGRGYLTSTNV